jgi:hypothetical protein
MNLTSNTIQSTFRQPRQLRSLDSINGVEGHNPVGKLMAKSKYRRTFFRQ